MIPPPPPQPPKPPRRDPATLASHRITRVTLGIAVLAAVAVAIIGRTGSEIAAAETTVLALAAVVGVIGAGIVTAGALGRRSGGLAPLGILFAMALGVACLVAAADVRSSDRISVVGDRDWRPTTAGDAGLDYNLGVGEATLWLTDPRILSTRPGTAPIDSLAQVAAGTLTVVVPDGTPVEVRAELAGGSLVRPDGSRERFDGGRNDDTAEIVRTGPAGNPVIRVEARVGFGEIVVRTATPTHIVTPSVAPSLTPSAAPSATPTATPAASVTTPAPLPTTTPEVTP